MNTNMKSANIGNNVINNAIHNAIHNAALQLLIAGKKQAQVVSFESETGWSWRDACTTALEAGSANLLASMSDAEIAEFEASTGWKWSDAVDESILAGIEAELRQISQNADNAKSELLSDQFERETGWNLGDAVDMAAECQREDRLFGRRVH